MTPVPLLTAPSPSEWLATCLPIFTGRYDDPAAEHSTRSAGVADLLADDAAHLRAVHVRLVAEYDATPMAAAKWLVSWVAGELAGAVGFTLAAASAGLLVHRDGARWRIEDGGRPGRVDPGTAPVVVAAGHPWAGLHGVEVVDDVVERAVTALADAVEPLVEACRRLARIGRTAAWTEVADGFGSAVLFVPGLPVEQRAVDVLHNALDTAGAPWRQRPQLRVADTDLGRFYLGPKLDAASATRPRPGRSTAPRARCATSQNARNVNSSGGSSGEWETDAMIVRVGKDGAVVRNADDCGRLHVETDLDEADLRTALTTTGTGELVDADNAQVDLATLRSRAALLATAPDWAERWTAMTGYAQQKGWLSEDGLSVQVHVERT